MVLSVGTMCVHETLVVWIASYLHIASTKHMGPSTQLILPFICGSILPC